MRRYPLFSFFVFACCVFLAHAVTGQTATYTALHTFCGNGSSCTGGDLPVVPVIQASDGNFYSGSQTQLYSVTPAGSYKLLYTFCALANCPDGNLPQGLIQGIDGSFYGTNGQGGTYGGGTLFKLTQNGVFSVLHEFCASKCAAGTAPTAAPIEDASGNFYGTTSSGGANNAGTIWEIPSGGQYTVLYSFCSQTNCADGSNPSGKLLMNQAGTLVGTTTSGGAFGYGEMYAFLFNEFSILYSFCQDDADGNCEDGANPNGVTADAGAGGYYVSTDSNTNAIESGKAGLGVFDIVSDNDMPVAAFADQYGSSSPEPVAGYSLGTPLLGSDGNLYGVTNPDAAGQAFEISSLQGTPRASVIFDFGNNLATNAAGLQPLGPLVQGNDGNLYGVTDGDSGSGTVSGNFFRLNITAPPPVQLAVSSSTIKLGSSFNLTWFVAGTQNIKLAPCFATAPAGAGQWSGVQPFTATPYETPGGSAKITPTADGLYTYALTCGGVESGFVQVNVTADGKNASAVAVIATPNPATIGQPVTLTATVSRPFGTAVPTGTVNFYSGGMLLGTATVGSAGKASLTLQTNGLRPETYTVNATYSGDSDYDGSTSPAISVVGAAETIKTATALTFSANPAYIGQNDTLTATVTAANGSTVNAGSVTFSYGSYVLGTATVGAGGQAMLSESTAGLPAVTYGLTATYNGNEPWFGSTSPVTGITLARNNSTVGISATPNPAVAGNEVTFMSTVTRTSGTGTPSGTVSWAAGSTSFGSAALSSGTAAAVFSTVGIPAGTYQVVATYGGDSADAVCSSAPLSLTLTTSN